jgi:hypothetical protein
MKTSVPLAIALTLILACSLSSSAQEKGYWRATSSNAVSITGDVTISDTKITLDYTLRFTIAPIRRLAPAETSAAFNAEASAGGNGNLYSLSIPAAQRFLHHNTLCGSDETQWMATYVVGHDLQVAFFSGSSMPVFTSEAIANSTNLCGIFTYGR